MGKSGPGADLDSAGECGSRIRLTAYESLAQDQSSNAGLVNPPALVTSKVKGRLR